MNKEQNLKELEQESFREYNRDGLNEVNFGILFLLIFNGLYLGIPDFASISPIVLTWLELIIIIFLLVYIIFNLLYYKVYRQKYVHPRIGYLKLRDARPLKEKLGILAFSILYIAEVIFLIHIVSTNVVTIHWVYRWIPVFSGLTAFGFCIILKTRSGQNRYYLLGFLMIITGFVVALAEFIPIVMVPMVYFDGWGIAFIAMGVIKFVQFIRKYPIIDTSEVVDNE